MPDLENMALIILTFCVAILAFAVIALFSIKVGNANVSPRMKTECVSNTLYIQSNNTSRYSNPVVVLDKDGKPQQC